ncbi:hypothetical protein [Streptomyces sp. NPDC057580]|uniref:hypothetical protein n=1 Tax=Streptomyces sp. NPDC057580 TaxID=3346173 RepID=UPI00369749E9
MQSSRTITPPERAAFFSARSSRGERGEEFDDFLHPAALGGGGDAVTAGHVGQALVVTEHGEHDERLVAGGRAPTGADLMTATAYRTGNEIDGPLRQREPDLAANVVRASPRSA